MTLKQDFYSYMYQETRLQENAAHTNNTAEKETARKR